jgi:two-component system, LytTR family, response regulator
MLRTIVIDDERLAREVICNYLKTYGNDIEIVATASSVKTAYKAIIKHQPDFIFLDVEMADGKGFDLLLKFEKIDFKVIFVTAYSEYAVKAFRFSAVDYLLKPVKIDELISAVEKIKSLNGQASGIEALSELMKNLNKEPSPDTCHSAFKRI